MTTFSALPEGWRREEMKRTNGLSSGKIEVCYISPDGQKIKSKAELAQYLGPNIDLTTFDFKTGRINSALLRKPKNRRTGLYDYRTLKMDQSLTPPVRQTPIICKTSATIKSTQPNSTVYNYQQIKEYSRKHNLPGNLDPKFDTYKKPYQVFWQKRLQGLQARINESEDVANFELPHNMKAFMNSLADNSTLVRSVTASLHQNQSIRGQDKHALQPRKRETVEIEEDPRNPVAFINPHQPLIISTTITEDDIRRQEEAVQAARTKLTSVIQDLYV